jgi:hypothetical protein
LSNINLLCAELSVKPQSENPFNIFITDSPGLEKFTEVTKKCVQKLLETIEKINEYESGAIVENCRSELQVNDILTESMKYKIENKKYIEEIERLKDLVETLSIEKTTLSIRLIKKGEYKIDSQSPDKINENVEEIKNERDMYKDMLSQETKKNSRNKFQQEISNEKIVQSKAFKNLIHQAKALRKKLEVYKQRNESLYKYKEDFREMLRKESHQIMIREEDKRELLVSEIKAIQNKLYACEREKKEALLSLENLKTISKEYKNGKHWEELIEILTKDKELLKSKNAELNQKISEISKKLEELETHKFDPSQDSEVSKLHKVIDDYKQKLKSEHSTVESLINEIELTGNAYEKLEEKTKSLTLQISEQETLYNKLMNEKVKESSWRSLYDQETKTYEQKIKSLEEIIASHELVHKEYENQLKLKQDMIASLESKCKELESKVKFTLENSEESLMRFQEILEYRKDYINSLKKSEDLTAQISQEKLDLNIKLEDCKKTVNILEDKLRKEQDLHNLKSADELLNTEVAQYRVLDI